MITLKNFQAQDIARMALHDGAICAWDTGIGKSFVAFLYPMVKLGVRITDVMEPLGTTLIVTNGDLISQIADDERDSTAAIFYQVVVRIKDKESFLAMSTLDKVTGRRTLPNGFYVATYQALAHNGVSDPPADWDEGWRATIGEVRDGIKCAYSPTLADLCWNTFDCVILDEGVKIKSADSLIGQGVCKLAPRYRLVMTATAVKNRFPDAYRLAWWACGGNAEPTARWPFADTPKDFANFCKDFMVAERNLTKEAEFRNESGKRRRFEKLTPQVCNIHRSWKLLAPIVCRRRKEDCGEEIVPMHRHVLRVPMGVQQSAVYGYHLKAKYVDEKGKPAIGAQLQALRNVAADPTSSLLHQVGDGKSFGNWRSDFRYTPKMAAVLKLVEQILSKREQVIIFSAFHSPLDVLSGFFTEAGVPHLVLDGRTNAATRGRLASGFKEGLLPVCLAGEGCMSEGHDFWRCPNVIRIAFDWALDKGIQCVNRIWRLPSPAPVHYWAVICQGSIDRKLEELTAEKRNASELVLDGKLLTAPETELNLWELLNIAQEDFRSAGTELIEETTLQQEWPALKERIRIAAANWKERKMAA